MENSTHTYDIEQALTANAFTRTGYAFEGWATSETGEVIYSNSQSVTNLTSTSGEIINLYAIWVYSPEDIIYFEKGSVNTEGVYSFGASGSGGSSYSDSIIAGIFPKGSTIYYELSAGGSNGSGSAGINGGPSVSASNSTQTKTGTIFVDEDRIYTFYAGGGGASNGGGGGTVTITKVINSSGKQCTFKISPIYRINYVDSKGTNVPNMQYKPKSVDIKLSTQVPTRTNFIFMGWGTSSTATEATYQPGDIYKLDKNLSLYAIWQSIDPSRTLVFSNGIKAGGGGGGGTGGGGSSQVTLPANVIVYYTLTAIQTGGGSGSASISFGGTSKDSASGTTSGTTVTKSGSFTTTESGNLVISGSGGGGQNSGGSGYAEITRIVGTDGTEYILDW